MRPLFPLHVNQVPARSPLGSTHTVMTGKNSCRLPARIVDVDQCLLGVRQEVSDAEQNLSGFAVRSERRPGGEYFIHAV